MQHSSEYRSSEDARISPQSSRRTLSLASDKRRNPFYLKAPISVVRAPLLCQFDVTHGSSSKAYTSFSSPVSTSSSTSWPLLGLAFAASLSSTYCTTVRSRLKFQSLFACLFCVDTWKAKSDIKPSHSTAPSAGVQRCFALHNLLGDSCRNGNNTHLLFSVSNVLPACNVLAVLYLANVAKICAT